MTFLNICNSTVLILILISYTVSGHNNYALYMEKAEVLYEDADYITSVVVITKINKTTFALNSNYSINKPITVKNDWKFTLQYFAMFSNEYRPVPIKVSRKMCEAFSMEYLLIKDEVEKFAHLPDRCPVEPGFYWVRDFIPNASKLPGAIPWEKMMVQVDFSDVNSNKQIGRHRVYARIDQNIKYTKKFIG